MSSVKFTGNSSGTGVFTIESPNSNTDRTLTLPDGAGELLISPLTTSLDLNGNELILDTDGDTSIHSDTDDRIDIKVGGSDKLHVNSDGKLLFATTSSDTDDVIQIESPASGGGYGIQIRRNDNNTDQQIGSIKFGNTSDSDIAQITGKTSGAANSGSMLFHTAESGTTSERMRIKKNGTVGVGYSDEAQTSKLSVHQSATDAPVIDCRSISSSYTNICLLVGSNTNTTNNTYEMIRADIHGVAQKFSVRDSGNVKNTNNSYGALSDSRMKENIVDANSQWDDIKAVQVRRYNRIGETDVEMGVIAQELEASGMGGLVEEGPYFDAANNPDEETRKSVKYSILYMKAVKALQEAMTRIETLETKVAALEAAQ